MKHRILSLLVLLMTAATGAWAQEPDVKELTPPAEWNGNEANFTAADLPCFMNVTETEARAWTGAPATGHCILIYNFSGAAYNYVIYSDGAAHEDIQTAISSLDIIHHITEEGSKVFYTYDTDAYPVTFNADKTEATFTMPYYEVYASYELARDMSVGVTTSKLDTRYRIAWDKEHSVFDFVAPIEFTVTDILDPESPKQMTLFDVNAGTGDYYIQLEKKGETEGEWTNAEDLANLTPGTFRYRIQGINDYDGTFYTSEFELYQGYEVYVPAHEYVTYCSTEALTLEDENAALYTITAVSNSEATLSRALTVAPATMPLLVENNSDESRTILLIPTDKQADDVTKAEEFIGVLDAETTLSKNDYFDYYAFNGLDFVYVVNSVNIPVGKCFIGIQTGNLSARSITIRRSATAIGATLVNSEEVNSEEWFDLNGRKVNKPTKKGIYIKNGKKVVIK